MGKSGGPERVGVNALTRPTRSARFKMVCYRGHEECARFLVEELEADPYQASRSGLTTAAAACKGELGEEFIREVWELSAEELEPAPADELEAGDGGGGNDDEGEQEEGREGQEDGEEEAVRRPNHLSPVHGVCPITLETLWW